MRNTEKYPISYASAELPRVSIHFDQDEKMTHDDMKDATDINNIVRDFAKTGAIPVGAATQPTFGDFTALTSYEEALTFIRDAEMQFMDLPAKERAEYDNDPAKWVEHHTRAAQEAQESAAAEQEALRQAEEEKTALANAQALLDANS